MVTKIIEPIWCIEAKIICAPDSTVKIPKTICNDNDTKIIKMVLHFNYIFGLFRFQLLIVN